MCETNKITKLDAASRHIREAIRMFFEGRDPTVVHTVVSAATQIVEDLGRHRGIPASLLDLGVIRKDKEAEFRRLLRAPANFLKHADSDPDEVFDFRPGIVPSRIFLAVMFFELVSGSTNRLGREGIVFKSWMILKEPQLFRDGDWTASVRSAMTIAGADANNLKLFALLLDEPVPAR